MKKIFIFTVATLGLFSTGFFSVCSAETLPVAEETAFSSEAETIPVADVNISNVKVISQNKNSLRASFKLTNDDSVVQPGINYSFELTRENKDKTNSIIDFKAFSDSITLLPKQSITKEIEYIAPSNLAGNFQLWIKAKSPSGLLYAFEKVGDLKLSQSVAMVFIDPVSCFLQTKNGEGKFSEKFSLSQNIQNIILENDDALLLNCTVQNQAKEKITLIPVFETQKIDYGGLVADQEIDGNFPIILSSGEKKNITMNIPKANTPQEYLDILTLKKDGQDFSNKIIFRYILKGDMAIIQNIKLDKDFYQKGDIAKINLLWTGVSSNSQNFLAEFKIANEKSDCSALVSKKIDSANSSLNLEIPITSECLNPQIKLSIKGEGGNILASENLTVSSPSIQSAKNLAPQKEKNKIANKNWPKIILIILIIALFFVVMIYIGLLKKRRNGKFLIFLVGIIFSSFFFVNINKAKATTYWLDYNKNGIQFSYSFVLNKADYIPSEDGHYSIKGNTSLPGGTMVSLKVNNKSWNGTSPIHFTAQSSVGNYAFYLLANVYNSSKELIDSIYTYAYYSVSIHPVPGECSSLSRFYACGETEFPGICPFFCSVGSSTPSYDYLIDKNNFPTYGRTLSWTCSGLYGGAVASCRARRDNCTPVNGACGSANGKIYPYSATVFNPYSLCQSGIIGANSPSFPEPGQTVTWKCFGIYGGIDSGNCSASREAAATPVDGECGTASKVYPASATVFGTDTFCSKGTISPVGPPFPAFPSVGSPSRWECLGLYEGKKSPFCEASICPAGANWGWIPNGSCIGTCTNGTQTQTSICLTAGGNTAPEACCSGDKPSDSSVPCNPNPGYSECSDSDRATHCVGNYTDGCNPTITCTGTKDCTWQEVAP
ncbi:MAG TPA: hypothetical protein P5232_02770 [Candidatus Moranbacteria bacterium]|nr:hypothetical protein [Candidatus Moranbacteria bacterium]